MMTANTFLADWQRPDGFREWLGERDAATAWMECREPRFALWLLWCLDKRLAGDCALALVAVDLDLTIVQEVAREAAWDATREVAWGSCQFSAFAVAAPARAGPEQHAAWTDNVVRNWNASWEAVQEAVSKATRAAQCDYLRSLVPVETVRLLAERAEVE